MLQRLPTHLNGRKLYPPASLESLDFCVGVANICIIAILYDLSLLSAQFCYVISSQSQSHIMTYDQSASQSSCQALSGAQEQILFTYRHVQLRLMWGSISDYRKSLPFVAIIISSICHRYLKFNVSKLYVVICQVSGYLWINFNKIFVIVIILSSSDSSPFGSVTIC
jgi:hypothetical protein